MSLTISQALAESQLDPVDARTLLRHALGVDTTYLIAQSRLALSDAQCELFSTLVARRRRGEPVAYITGLREFFSLEFKVTPAVLIPRTETELLVEFALEHMAPDTACRVLDLGTGSGCIAISIAKQRPRAEVVAVDTSDAALEVARENAQRLLVKRSDTPSPVTGGGTRDTAFAQRSGAGASAWARSPQAACFASNGPARRDGGDIVSIRDACTPTLPLPHQGGGNLILRFAQSDWFGNIAGQYFDLIVSNPPYVAADDPHLVEGDLRFEPKAALAAGNDGLECIHLIVASAPRYLSPGGWLAFEHGYDQGSRCRELLSAAGFTRIFSRTDLAGIERISGGQRAAAT